MKKVSGILAAVFLCLLLCRSEVYAATQDIAVNLAENRTDCIFQIAWEETEKEASVRIVSPSGQVYGTEETPDQVTVMTGFIYVYIGDAAAGQWTVSVTGDGLGSAEVTVGSLPESMNVDVFSVTETGNGSYRAEWSISDCPEDVTIRIYASKNPDSYEGTEVSGSGRGAAGNMNFTMPDVDSGYYYFYLSVTAGSGAFNYAYCDTPYFYDNTGRADKLTAVSAGLLNSDIYISWEGEAGTYLAMLFDPDTKELLLSEETEEQSSLLAMPEGYTTVLAGAASYDSGRLGRFDLYEVSADNMVDATVQFPDESATNRTVVTVNVTFSGNCTVSATLNGELMLEQSTEAGDYSVELEEGDNTIVFMVSDANGNMASFVKELYLDSIAPQLSMARNLDGVTVDEDYIYVEGYTEAGASLTCNGQKIELVGNYFSYRQPLSLGKNEIRVVAADIAGNETQYTAEVRRPFWSSGILRWIILGAAAVALILVETVLLVRGKRRSRR